MTNCTITIDVTGFGYTYLLQLDAMLSDFLSDGDNAAAADALHDWMQDNARNFADDARANGDTLAHDIFSDLAEADDDPDDDADDTAPETDADDDPYDTEVAAWRSDPRNSNLDAALKANAADTNNDPNNLYRAGVFAGMAEAAAWAIYATSTTDDIHAITAAIYKAYGVAY